MKSSLAHIPQECVAYNFMKTARHLAAYYRKVISPSGLQGTQFPLLLVISLYEPVSITNLAKILELDRTTLSRNLKRLQSRGYINLEKDADQRVRNVELTQDGIAVLESAVPLWEKAQDSIVLQFGEDNWNNMLKGMQAIEEIVG